MKKKLIILIIIQFVLLAAGAYLLMGAIEKQNNISIGINLFIIVVNLICIPFNLTTLRKL